MQHYLCLFLAFAATNTLANPGNGYPYAVPHPDFKKQALEKRDANEKRDFNAPHRAEYKAYMNIPAGFDKATKAQREQYYQLKSDADDKARAAKEYGKTWHLYVQQAKKATTPNEDCSGFSILGTCIDADAIKNAVGAATPAPADADAPAADAPADDDKKDDADPPAPPAYLANLYAALGYPYGGGSYGYGCGGGYSPYYGGGYPGSYYGGGGYPGYGYGYGYGGGYPSPYGCGGAGFAVPPGYPKPGKGPTSCDDVKNHGYICSDSYNELSYCFKTPTPYYFGFGNPGGSEGTGSVTIAKCCYFGTCAASDDGLIGFCACAATDTKDDS